MMLTLRCARRTRVFLSPPPSSTANLFSTAVSERHPISPAYPFAVSAKTTAGNGSISEVHHSNLVSYFRDWFMSRRNPLFDRIFEVLRTQEGSSADSALSDLNLSLTESLVLDVLNYEKRDILCCLKFFDWAGRQPGFYHTRATFNSIFRMISKAKLMNLMVDLLQNFMKQGFDKAMYYNTLVIGYAVAGKSETALGVFGKMRFQGLDLDALAYHVLMDSLVEEKCFEFVECVARQIRLRGFQNHVTHSIIIKSLCEQNELERGEEYLRRLLEGIGAELNGVAMAIFVGALCKNRQFKRASLLIDEFQKLGLNLMENVYGVWIKELVKAGKLDHALEFLKEKQGVDGYVPDIFRCNTLIHRLLRENRLEEVYDLLVDMKERDLMPNNGTMNAVLCFLCKAGLPDIAMELYNSRVEFGLSVNFMAYNYLINSLLGEVSANETYQILRDSIEHGYIPGGKTFSIIADALNREGKLDELKELVLFILDHNIVPNTYVCNKFISAMCSVGRVEEGYLLHDLLNRMNKVSRRSGYSSLISGFNQSNRGDIAARLLIEMQESGHSPSRKLFSEVISCLCNMDNGENQFWGLFEIQLAGNWLSTPRIFHAFIEGAGFAGKPELALQVYELMKRNGLVPNFTSDILLLRSYLKNHRTAHVLQLFCDLCKRWQDSKIWRIMVVGLCRVKEPEYASKIMQNMKVNKLTPSSQCYEELIKLYCDLGQYPKAVDLLNDMISIGRPVSSFIGNVFLLHALKTKKLYDAWVSSSLKQDLTPSCWMLGHLVGIFSGCVPGRFGYMYYEALVQKCFPVDIYTNNMLLRRLSMDGIDHACNFFNRICDKGYEPNRWTYDIIVHGLAKSGRNAEARTWMEDMLRKGYGPTEGTQKVI
ncbi:hypothetical protein ACS0TY_034668 [Phlomoides rotata]